MGAILCNELVDERMAELTAALGHNVEPDPCKERLCERCHGPRGNGHKWCEGCRTARRSIATTTTSATPSENRPQR